MSKQVRVSIVICLHSRGRLTGDSVGMANGLKAPVASFESRVTG